VKSFLALSDEVVACFCLAYVQNRSRGEAQNIRRSVAVRVFIVCTIRSSPGQWILTPSSGADSGSGWLTSSQWWATLSLVTGTDGPVRAAENSLAGPFDHAGVLDSSFVHLSLSAPQRPITARPLGPVKIKLLCLLSPRNTQRHRLSARQAFAYSMTILLPGHRLARRSIRNVGDSAR